MMKKKKFLIICIALSIIITSIPMISAQETLEIPTPIFNKMAIAHVEIDGEGSSIIIASKFVFGFGRCAFMRIKLDDSGHIEIYKPQDETNHTVLDGNHVVIIFGFFGYYENTDDIELDGFAALVYWK